PRTSHSKPTRRSRPERNRRFVPPARYWEDFDLHPEGHSAALTVRGGAFTMGLWDGPVVRRGTPSSERRRLVRWLPDGKRLAMVSDRSGEEALYVEAADGAGSPRKVAGDFGRAVDLLVAPAGGARAALTTHDHRLLLVDLGRKAPTKTLDRCEYVQGFQGMAFSPDGRYLAYAIPVTPRTVALRVVDTTTDRKVDVTRGEFADVAPAFDPEGKYLCFISWRIFDPVYDSHYFALGFPRGARPYLVPLKKDEPSPFDEAQRAPRGPIGGHADGPAEGGRKDGKAGKPKPPKVVIDFPGIEDRICPFPVPEGRYEKILMASGRAFFSSHPIEGALDVDWAPGGEPAAHSRLEVYEFERERTETLVGGMTDFALSANGKALAVRIGNRLRVRPSAAPAAEFGEKEESGRAGGWVDLARLSVEVRPGDEWRQMYQEAWRLQRDQFWTADMAGVDWHEAHDRYLPLVDRAACRSEFTDLVWEMQGELGTSHCYEFGGEYRPTPAWNQGFLGADLEFLPRKGVWRIARIPRGDVWDASHASPLGAPGLGAKAGDVITAVNGTAVGKTCSPYQCLIHTVERPVRLTLRRGSGKERTVVVKAARSETPLRYRDWVEANRAHVHAATKGRVGYVHIPNMMGEGYAEFHRYFRLEVDRLGLLVDVRFNGGGHVSQLLLEKLRRRRIGYDVARDQKSLMSYPEDAPMGPMVALTNEYAGSDGDIFSHGFKLYGLGPLIGKRTWGGVIGIWPRHALVDGTLTTQPQFANWFVEGGWSVENHGTDPDIEVDIRPQDFAKGRDPQIERAIQEVEKIIRREKPKLPKLPPHPSRKPPRLPKA
ncbi:MAG: S41 family peptidase, partial [Planctomycetota bacterium]